MEPTDYFYVSERAAFVTGARHAVLADLEGGGFRRPNEAARKVIELGEQGLTVAEAVAALRSEYRASEVLAFISALSAEGLMSVSPSPRSLPAERAPAPLDFLWIEVTGRCNLRCIHCYAEADGHHPRGLPTRVLTDALDEAAEMGCRNLQLTGGECTLRPDLRDLITHARSRDFEMVEIFTNGTLLDESLVEFLARTGVAVAVSLHSCHAGCRGVSRGPSRTWSTSSPTRSASAATSLR
jgi:sulfatase maturation enzyme AslB (radical SAM superfamily)